MAQNDQTRYKTFWAMVCPASPAEERGTSIAPASTLFDRVAFQQHSVIHQPSLWSVVTTRDYGFGAAPGGFDALANSFAFADFCGAARRNARRIGAIADFLSLVFAQRRRE
jgi:hypothetical protein